MPASPAKRIQAIQHQGHPVISVDSSHCGRDEREAVLKDYIGLLQGLAPGEKILSLLNFEGSDYDARLAGQWRSELALFNDRVRRSAVIGLSPLALVSIQGFRNSGELMGSPMSAEHAMVFNDRESALNWLVQGA